MTLTVALIKTQGENRERGDDGRLHATQRATFQPVLISAEGHIVFRGNTKPSLPHARKSVEEVFGVLDWQGYPDYCGLQGEKWGHVKAAARIRIVGAKNEER